MVYQQSGNPVAEPTYAGDYNVYASYQQSANYTAASDNSKTLTIGKRAITVTADTKSKTYGDDDPSLTYQITSGSLVAPDAFQGSLSRAEGENVGSYAITQSSLALSNNYVLAFIPADLTITQATPTITWANPLDIIYGTALSPTQLNATANVPGDFTYTPSAGTQLNASDAQTLSVLFTPEDAVNYTTATATATINVKKATPLITWENPAYIIYGTALSATQLNAASGGVAGDFMYTPAAGTILNAGDNQTLSVNFTPTDASNYNTPATKTVKINVQKAKALVSVTGYEGTYDAQPHQASGSVTGVGGVVLEGLTLGDSFTNAPGGTAHWTFEGNPNYEDESGTVAITINKAPLTVTVADKMRVYGAANPPLTGTMEGVQGDDNITVAYSTTAADNSDVVAAGYPISATLSSEPAGTLNNYSITNTPGTLTITPAIATIQVTGYEGIYDGQAHGASGSATGVNGVDLSSSLDLGQTFTNVPGGTADWRFDAGANYQKANASVAINIGKANATISLTGLNITYDGSAHAATATTSPAGLAGVAVNYFQVDGPTKTAVLPENVKKAGSYAVEATLTNPNYKLVDAGSSPAQDLEVQTGTLVIARKLLSATIANPGKVYDRTTAAPNTTIASLGEIVGSDEVAAEVVSSAFNNASAGSRTVTAQLRLTGDDKDNYSLAATATVTASITPKPLSAALVGTVSKSYDGTAVATLAAANYSLSGAMADDAVALNMPGAGSYNNKAVGTGKAVTVTGLAIDGADALNYSLPFTTAEAGIGSISAKELAISISSEDKVYDGGTEAKTAAFLSAASGLVAGDKVTVNSVNGAFADKNVASGKTVTATVSKTGDDAGNYSANETATTTAAITALQLTPHIVAYDKVYDGTTTATLSSQTVTGMIPGETLVNLNVSAASFASKDKGTHTVTASGLTLGGDQSGNYALATGATATDEATINARSIEVTANAGQSKVYGTPLDPVLAYSITTGSKVADDNFSGQLARALGESVNAYAIGLGSLSLGTNYDLRLAPGSTFAITAKALTASIQAQNRVYNATTGATATGSVPPTALIGDDKVTVDVINPQFNNKNVGMAKPVTAAVALSGPAAGNYNLTATTASTTANITAAELTPNFTAANKEYDGTTKATITGRSVQGVQVAAGVADQVSLSGGSACFADKNVGNGKTVTGSAFLLIGTDAENYYLPAANPTAQANITPRDLTITATGVNKPFDGNTSATASLSDNRVKDDDLTTAYTSASFADAGTGTGKTVTVTGISITGTDAGNYTPNTTTSTTASIFSATSGITVVSNGPVQYSDQVTFTATITSTTAQSVLNATGGTVEFKLTKDGTPSATPESLGSSTYPANWSSAANGPATVTKSFIILQKPGTYTVSAIFTPNSSNITGITSQNACPLTVTQEAADVVYSGLEYFSTSSPTSLTANNVEYIATLTDKDDTFRGDVTNARAAFMEVSSTGTETTALFSSPSSSPADYLVSMLNSPDVTVGVARTGAKSITLSSGEAGSGGKTLNLITVAKGDYYKGRTTDCTLITIAVPGQDFVNGGGSSIIAQSGGTYAAPANSRMNFGFTMKWNKTGKNVQGQANIIFRRLESGIWKTYQIKSNAINTLGTTTSTAGNQGDFNTKANLTDITDPLNPKGVGSSLDLSVQAFESVLTGGAHKIGITLRTSTGGLVFSNNWTGAKTEMQALKGGKISVRSTSTLSAVSSAQSTTLATMPGAAELTNAAATPLGLYPNPFSTKATLSFALSKAGSYELAIYDAKGMLMKRLQTGQAEAGRLYSVELNGSELAEGLYFARLITGSTVQTARLMVRK
ncbi:hypothetical protein PK28_01030 [Hymenobacter sp. DG25B]|nr:hypothetical protein PK28_01030 [Hymenobacter sp. DG25B]